MAWDDDDDVPDFDVDCIVARHKPSMPSGTVHAVAGTAPAAFPKEQHGGLAQPPRPWGNEQEQVYPEWQPPGRSQVYEGSCKGVCPVGSGQCRQVLQAGSAGSYTVGHTVGDTRPGHSAPVPEAHRQLPSLVGCWQPLQHVAHQRLPQQGTAAPQHPESHNNNASAVVHPRPDLPQGGQRQLGTVQYGPICQEPGNQPNPQLAAERGTKDGTSNPAARYARPGPPAPAPIGSAFRGVGMGEPPQQPLSRSLVPGAAAGSGQSHGLIPGQESGDGAPRVPSMPAPSVPSASLPSGKKPAAGTAAPAGSRGPTRPSAPPAASQGTVKYTATLSLDEGRCLAVRVGHHEFISAAFGRIPGVQHDPSGGGGGPGRGPPGTGPVWRFPVEQYRNVLEALDDRRLAPRGLQVALHKELPEFVERALEACTKRTSDEKRYESYLARRQAGHVCAAAGLMGTAAGGAAHGAGEETLDERMMPFQRDGVRHALRLGGRALIGDEMGLGKTVQACCIMRCYQDEWPALVVTPKSLRETWADALFKWLKLTDRDVLVVGGTKELKKIGHKVRTEDYKVVIVSYDSLQREPDELLELNPQVVVLDEAHYIKNGKAKRTQAALPLIQRARRAVLLTGTPALSKPQELVPLLQGLLPNARIKEREFAERYCRVDPRFPTKYIGTRNEGELNRLLLATVMVRRLKKDVLKHLPAKIRQQVFIRLPDDDMRKLRSMASDLAGIKAVMDAMGHGGPAGAGMQGVAREQQQTIMRLWRDTAQLKANAVSEYVSDLLEAGCEKFLVFAHHRDMLDKVEEKCKALKVSFIRIDGDTPAADRQAQVTRFQEDADVRVAVLSIKAAGVGLTMTAASTVVFAEMTWVPGDITQAEDRCHRIGQHTCVNIHYLLVRNSIDEIMWDTVNTKLDNVGKVLDGAGARMDVARERELRGYAGSRDEAAGGAAGYGAIRFAEGVGAAGQHRLVGAGLGAGAGADSGGGAGQPAAGKAATSGKPASEVCLRGANSGSIRRISDFFAPAVGLQQVAGQKRSRQHEGLVETVDMVESADDDEDFVM